MAEVVQPVVPFAAVGNVVVVAGKDLIVAGPAHEDIVTFTTI